MCGHSRHGPGTRCRDESTIERHVLSPPASKPRSRRKLVPLTKRNPMLRIHGSARSRALRTLWMTFELGIPYEHNDILPRAPTPKTPEFLALNPNARVPVV